jgi:hypothetical protein
MESVREYRRLVRDVWCEVLRIEGFDPDENFFNLGGSSVLMARVRAELTAELARDVSIVALYRCPTVNTLARHLAGGTAPPARCAPGGPGIPGDERARRLAARRMTKQNQEGP